MRNVMAAAVLVMASGATMAKGFSNGNVDLADWVVDDKATASAATPVQVGGRYSRGNVDLDGWVVENQSAPSVSKGSVDRSDRYSISKGNVDLFGWVVADVMAE